MTKRSTTKSKKTAPTRRMGSLDAETRLTMLDAAEEILRDEGHAALTSRRVAECIGVQQRLVYYYFQTMDDLIVETFRRLAVRERVRIREATSSDRPVRALWNIGVDATGDARFIAEFMALSNRIAPLRTEVVAFIEENRRTWIDVLAQALKRRNVAAPPAAALAVFAVSLGLALKRESHLGISAGHSDALAMVATLLNRLEPAPAAEEKSGTSKRRPQSALAIGQEQSRATIKAVNRRLGPADAPARHAFLDGTEELLREEGYSALTSRRVAERMGQKQQLFYYYFKSMDDAVSQTFQRLAVRELQRLQEAASSSNPLGQLWNACIHTSDARMISEFMALAHRSDAIRTQVASFIEESRRIQINAIRGALKKADAGGSVPGLALLATSLALTLVREMELGVSLGHESAIKVVLDFIEQPGAQARAA